MFWSSKDPLLSRLASAMKYEPAKYRHLGIGKYITVFTLILYFTLYLDFLKWVWPYVQGSLPDVPLYVAVVILVNLLTTLLYNCVMYFIYTVKHPFFEQYRVDPHLPWPWESDPSGWPAKLKSTILVTIFNAAIVSSSVTGIDALIEFRFNMTMNDIPSVSTMLWQIVIFFFVQEIGFYLAHRLMHHPSLYWIHKKHHSYNSTIALAVQYAHPIQQILANTIPTGLGYKLLAKVYPVHIFTIIIWLTFRMFETLDGHCGYDWPWSQAAILPFSAGSSYHSFHHSKNVGNYGAMLHIWDTMLGTNDDYYQALSKQAAFNQTKRE